MPLSQRTYVDMKKAEAEKESDRYLNEPIAISQIINEGLVKGPKQDEYGKLVMHSLIGDERLLDEGKAAKFKRQALKKVGGF